MELYRSAEREKDEILKEFSHKIIKPITVPAKESKSKTIIDNESQKQEPGGRDKQVVNIL